jgi:hypothetical protein
MEVIMKNMARAFAVSMTVLSITSIAGTRGPGEYCGVVVFDRWETCYIYSGDKPLPDSFTLKPQQKYSFKISLVLPRGEYDFLCGYGGGVHYEKSLASNIVAFDVDENTRATLVSISGR